VFARDLSALDIHFHPPTSSSREQVQQYMGAHDGIERRRPILALPRSKSVVFSFANKGVLYENELLMFESDCNRAVIQWTSELEARLEANPDVPFGLVVFEAVLEDVCDIFYRRLRLFSPLLENVQRMATLEHHDAFEGVNKLVPLQDSLQAFEVEVTSARQTILDLLEDSDPIPILRLTRDTADDDGALLLENFCARLSHALSSIVYHQRKLQTRINSVTMQMIMQRNRIMKLNLQTGIAAVSVGTGAFISGLFGMNVTDIENQIPLTSFPLLALGIAVISGVVHHGIKWYMLGRDSAQEKELMTIQDLKSMLADISNFDSAIKTAFGHIDRVGLDGQRKNRISREEFVGLFQSGANGAGSGLREAQVLALYDMLDKDNDGYLVRQELGRSHHNKGISRDLK